MTTNQHGGAEHHEGHAVEHKKGGNTMAIFAYLWILIIIPMLTDSKNDPFVLLLIFESTKSVWLYLV